MTILSFAHLAVQESDPVQYSCQVKTIKYRFRLLNFHPLFLLNRRSVGPSTLRWARG